MDDRPRARGAGRRELLYPNRRPKAPLRELALATALSRHPEEDRLEEAWQARPLSLDGDRAHGARP